MPRRSFKNISHLDREVFQSLGLAGIHKGEWDRIFTLALLKTSVSSIRKVDFGSRSRGGQAEAKGQVSTFNELSF